MVFPPAVGLYLYDGRGLPEPARPAPIRGRGWGRRGSNRQRAGSGAGGVPPFSPPWAGLSGVHPRRTRCSGAFAAPCPPLSMLARMPGGLVGFEAKREVNFSLNLREVKAGEFFFHKFHRFILYHCRTVPTTGLLIDV